MKRKFIKRTYKRKGFRRYKRKMFAKRVKRIVSNMAELKYFRSDILNYTRPLNQYSGVLNTAGNGNQVAQYYSVVQGVDKFQRSGAKIFCKHIYWNFTITASTMATPTYVRVVGVYPNKQGNDLGMRNSLNGATSWMTSIDKDLGSVFYDKRFLMGLDQINGIVIQKTIRVYKKINRVVTYNNPTGVPETNLPNFIVICQSNDTQTAVLVINGYVSLAFTDL